MRRAVLIGLALFALLLHGHQSQGQSWLPGVPFACSVDNQANSTAVCRYADPSGQSLYITDIVAQSVTATAGAFIVQTARSVSFGGLDNCASGATAIFPSSGATQFRAPGNASQALDYRPSAPIAAGSGKDLCVIGDAAGNNVTIQISGYVAP